MFWLTWNLLISHTKIAYKMGQIVCSTACLKEFIWTSDLEMGVVEKEAYLKSSMINLLYLYV